MKILLKNVLSLLVISALLLSCNKDDGPDVAGPPSFKGYIISFKAGTSSNALKDFFINNATGTITNKSLISYDVDLTKFIVEFTTNSSEENPVTVKIGDVVQNSGDIVDLSQPIVYDVYVGDKKQISYTLSIVTTKAPNFFKSFGFAEESMSAYSATISSVDGKLTFENVDRSIDISALTPVFTTLRSDAVVKVDGEIQESGVSMQDFSMHPVEYTIESEGKTNTFVISLVKESVLYTNPIIKGAYADPTVIRIGNKFYVYVTDGNRTRGYESDDMITWGRINNASNSYVMSSKPTFTEDDPSTTGIWAPDINYFDGKYVLYYSVSGWGGGATCGIGVAVSDNPGGPFVPPANNPSGKLFVSGEIGVNNSIDPCFVEAEDGTRYLFWGSFNGIYMTELSPDGMRVADLAKKTLVAGKSFEAVYIHKRNDYYYMFTSAGSCCEGKNSTYKVMVGRSQFLTGPYLNKDGKRMTDFNAWNPGDFPVALQGNNNFAGPGHNSRIITDDLGQDWVLYHAYAIDESGNTDNRNLMLDRVTWDTAGWPSIGRNYYPTQTGEGPYFYHNN